MSRDFDKVIRKAAKGHKKSQVLIYEDFYGYGMSVALRFCDAREEAKEIVHDAFLKAFTKLDSVVSAESFKPWFRRIVVNTAIDLYRKRKNEYSGLDIVENEAVDVSENAIEQLSAEDIMRAIQQLPPAYRVVFTLYAVEGYKHDEIADKLGISSGTSKSNLSKARAKLQKILAQWTESEGVNNG